jgi:hypothetical protein
VPSETIYIQLLGEGTTVWSPVVAERLIDGSIRIVSEMPDNEKWAFRPGQKVVVKQHVFANGVGGLAADRVATEHSSEFKDWEAVEHAVALSMAANSAPFDPSTIANVRDFHIVVGRTM